MNTQNEIEKITDRIEAIRVYKQLSPHQILLNRFPDWKTESTYTARFASPENKPGVYCFIGYKDVGLTYRGQILYIGSSKTIYTRYHGHDRRKEIDALPFSYVHFHFRYCDEYLKVERALIQEFNPLLNKVIYG